MDALTSVDLFKTVADVGKLKSGSKPLEVWVSIGGWHFQDDGTATQPLFGQISRDQAKRELFAGNALRFIDQFGFTGIDIEWYPGAPDRGGNDDDTANYVLLLKALREKLASSPRQLGLSITIPMTYQYLKWFDLPGLLPYVDWINLKSFDLHGYWNGDEVVDSTIRGHANLTEIKLAAELLWRNDVPPSKVVLGIGLYGRAFQLADPSCNAPGCPFMGAATPGACTNTAGVLANFEISDILNSSYAPGVKALNVVSNYDEEAAINYASFNEDQWVSFEDRASIQRKLDWANETGFLGYMEWPPKDDPYWNGLNSTSGQNSPQSETSQGQIIFGDGFGIDGSTANVRHDWTSLSGQQCYRLQSCVNNNDFSIKKCPGSDLQVGWDKAGCKSHNGHELGLPICCPAFAIPSMCTWRGGTGALGRPACNGQCHKGEMTLFTSSWGGGFKSEANTKRCTSGTKVFCCEAAAIYNYITKDCYYGPCGGGCDVPNTSKVDGATKHDPNRCTYPSSVQGPQDTDWCCPDPSRFQNCHWVGKGGCSENRCDDDDIQIDISRYGNDDKPCLLDRRRALCCNSPPTALYMDPIKTSLLFPEVPPEDNYIRYDMQYPKGDNVADVKLSSGFGFVVLDGPPDKIVSAKVKRDGTTSDLRFLDCQQNQGHGTWKARFICSPVTPDHDCFDMLEGGLEGTILELPQTCGPAKYAVLHSLSVAADQSIPDSFKTREDLTVMQLTFSYDFSRVKRDGEKVYFRIDYSNAGGDYFDQSPNHMNTMARSLERRLVSKDPAVLRQLTDKWLATSARHEGTIWEEDFKNVITSGQIDCANGKAYGNLSVLGSISAEMKVAVTIIGTIAPQIEIEEMWAVMNASIRGEMIVDQWQSGRLTIPATTAQLFPPIPKHAFNHSFEGLGMFNVAPTLGLGLAIAGDLDMIGNTTSIVSLDTSENIVVGWPAEVAITRGQSEIGSLEKRTINTGRFEGYTVFANGGLRVSINPSLELNVELVRQTLYQDNTLPRIWTRLTALIGGILDLGVNPWGEVVAEIGVTAAGAEVISSEGGFGGWDGGESREIGKKPSAQRIGVDEPAGTDLPVPPWHGSSPDGTPALSDQDSNLSCIDFETFFGTGDACGTPPWDCNWNACKVDGICTDADSIWEDLFGQNTTTGNFSLRDLLNVIRSSTREYDVTFPDGTRLELKSKAYPGIGSLFNGRNGKQVTTDVFVYEDEQDCANTNVKATPRAQMVTSKELVTEHIIELQTIKAFIFTAVTGRLPSGKLMKTKITPSLWFHQNWATNALPSNVPASWQGPKRSSRILGDRVFEALGSNRNRWNFVAADKELNGIKAKIWSHDYPQAKAETDVRVKGWLEKCNPLPPSFLKYLKGTRAVFSYLDSTSDVNRRMWTQAEDILTELSLAKQHITGGENLADAWKEFFT